MMIQIDPLRERPEDIPFLIKYYYKKFADNYQYKPIKIISNDTIEKLKRYSWPGNIRELQNVLQRIQIHDVNDERVDGLFSKFHNKIPKEEPSNLSNIKNTEGAVKNQNFSIPLKKIKKDIFTKIEKKIIPIALDMTYSNVSKASKILGISTKSLHTKIKEYGLNSKPDVNSKESNLRLFNNPDDYNRRFLEGIDFDNIFEPAAESIKAG